MSDTLPFDVSQLTPKQIKALEALLLGYSKVAAAQHAGIGVATLWRWLHEPAFVEAYNQILNAGYAQLAERFSYAETVALDTLIEVMSTGTRAQDRVQAARIIMEARARGAMGDTNEQGAKVVFYLPQKDDDLANNDRE